MKTMIRTLQLVVSAEEHRIEGKAIDETRLPEIEEARSRLALLRASNVVDALIALRRNGLPLRLDLSPAYRQLTDKPPARQGGVARNAIMPSLKN